jgi:hypothetical protein
MAKLEVKQIPMEEWRQLAEQAHASVFEEFMPSSKSRDAYALVIVDEQDQLVSYFTIHEVDSDTACIAYGGTFPTYKGTIQGFRAMEAVVEWLSHRYKSAMFMTRNDNFAMLKTGIRLGFSIIGIRAKKDKVLVEHFKHLNTEVAA